MEVRSRGIRCLVLKLYAYVRSIRSLKLLNKYMKPSVGGFWGVGVDDGTRNILKHLKQCMLHQVQNFWLCGVCVCELMIHWFESHLWIYENHLKMSHGRARMHTHRRARSHVLWVIDIDIYIDKWVVLFSDLSCTSGHKSWLTTDW